MKKLQVIIRGKVQGVSFRAFTQKQAMALGISGYVQNQTDGSVLAAVEGDELQLQHMLTALREGPPNSSVKALEICEKAVKGHFGFIIKH